MQPHFFTTTLGEAQQLNAENHHEINNINELLERRARSTPDLPAVGIGIPGEHWEQWDFVVYSYKELFDQSNAAAYMLAEAITLEKQNCPENFGPVVAILSDNSMDMLICFLALIRLGCTVLLIAPQCETTAIQHLLRVTQTQQLFCSELHSSFGHSAAYGICKPISIPDRNKLTEYVVKATTTSSKSVPPEMIAYIHHTSGTTSGRPSPITQSHAVATKYLPRLLTNRPAATLTTTPLYHGGIADIWRSMMSESMIWLYPPTVPLTAGNILKAIETSKKALPDVPVKIFTGVPYIQKICAENEACLEFLKRMDMVGVGGASLPVEVGNFMVETGVRLVSRFGSSECGFLLNSLRDFEKDKHWDYLRLPLNSPYLRFEPYGDDLYELVVLPGWPHMAKTNRDDGSFATSDLFTPHPTIAGAYRYVTRADSTLVLTNGKKFDPITLEEAVRRIRYVDEAIVIGQNRDRPGILVFCLPDRMSGMDYPVVVGEVRNALLQATPVSWSHASIDPEMVIVYTDGRTWPKSSKGTAIRKLAEEWFVDDINDAYKGFDSNSCVREVGKIPRTDTAAVAIAVARIISDVTGRKINGSEDLYLRGVDSIMAMSIRKRLLDGISVSSDELPSNVVYEHRTIEGIIEFLSSNNDAASNVEVQYQLMRDMVRKFSQTLIQLPRNQYQYSSPSAVILTGVTGTLGSHILMQLIRLRVPRIYCLIRASSNLSVKARLRQALQKRNFLCEFDAIGSTSEVTALASDFAAPHLGLHADTYHTLVADTTSIIHTAWPVNFLLPLNSFNDALKGVENMLQLANTGANQKRFIFCSSVASVSNALPTESGLIPEMWSSNPSDASPLGYSRSKWVAESIIRIGNGDIVRIGQLSGDRGSGVWNLDEGWPMMVKTVEITGCLPDLDAEGENITWLPVDVAGEIIAKLALRESRDDDKANVFTVANTLPVAWKRIVEAAEAVLGQSIELVEATEWIRRLDALEEKNGIKFKLLDLWKRTYMNQSVQDKVSPKFEVQNVTCVAPKFNRGYNLSDEYLWKLLQKMEIEQKGQGSILPN